MATTIPIRYAHSMLYGLRRADLDVALAVKRAGIPQPLLSSPHARMTREQGQSLFSEVVRTLDDESLGRAALPRPVGSFATMGLTLVAAQDLGDALRRMRRFLRMFPTGPYVRLVRADGHAGLEFDLRGTDDEDHFLAEVVMCSIHRFAEWLVGARIYLTSASFTYPRPAYAALYHHAFGCASSFGAAESVLWFDEKELARPVIRDERSLYGLLSEPAVDLLTRRSVTLTAADQVRRMIEQRVGTDLPTPGELADRLGISQATLRRRLQELGTSTGRIREQILRDAAITRLACDEPVSDIAALLGFSEVSAFYRAFKRWTGTTTTDYRPA
ncbi:AraC-type DNA-binding protein [Actinokineospora alba]|uniref:AraC-type DNA-binding protein n=1 Tax=Actinokineospora alba TaxID=504798 RepID=A0A1H0NH58_9PSEU|nr:AraC family transcriptional regulator ligand-binding domain-containing protein [Actinokineospora alba]TDP68721.1 AraC-like DNA-binding protein [Actinokineospora alba]SDH85216.1 AraC-type DNA-binding protein [Actinokineospora alba]SDO92102.1 AraC-type DNA-binding protein [Actinokineospora alba]